MNVYGLIFKVDGIMGSKQLRTKRIIAVISLLIAIGLMIAAGIFFSAKIKEVGIDGIKELLESYGWAGRFVALGVQILQVVVAFIPGEAVEIAAGYVFGAFEGTLICLVGVTIASTIVFVLTKKFGVKFVELFIDTEKINSLKFLNTESKLNTLVFLLYFIPGTPKDVITYFVGLTRMKTGSFILISLIARLPSVISSTIGGKYLAEGDYLTAGIVFAITALVSILGILIYRKIIKVRSNKTVEILKEKD